MSPSPKAKVIPKIIKGKRWFLKENPFERVSDIECRIYGALREDDALKERRIPHVQRVSDRSLLIEDVGNSFSEVIHTSDLLGLKAQSPWDVVTDLISTRAAVTACVNRTLTDDDICFLRSYQRERLHSSFLEGFSVSLSEGELAQHYWAYRVMHALQVYNPPFKECYTQMVGTKLDAARARYGVWVTDNCFRNNVFSSDGTFVPIDFNSLHEEVWQIDEAGIVPFFLFPGPLVEEVSDDVRDLIGMYMIQEYRTHTGRTDVFGYGNVFMAAAFHKQALLAGYRTQEMLGLYDILNKELDSSGSFRTVDTDRYLCFRKHFDEIEYHESNLWQILYRYNCALSVTDKESYEHVEKLIHFIAKNTRHHRSKLMLTDVWNIGERSLSYKR